MKNSIFIIFILTILLSGCRKDDVMDCLPADLPVITACFEQGETRTYVADGNLLCWNKNDQISFFYKSTVNLQYKFDGETGDNAGPFSPASQVVDTGSGLNCNYAVYPYASDIKITDAGIITATLPVEQIYTVNSFGLGANTMVAVTKDVDDTFLKFRNVGGYLKLQLYGENVTVKSITLTGNNNEKLAGKATISPAYGDEPTITMSDDAATSITLNCGDGVKIGTTTETATAFWIVVPPTTFEGGFEITITDTSNKVMRKSTTNNITTERNIIKPMTAFEVVTKEVVPNNQIWYTSTAKVEPYSSNAFGANISSNIWDETTKKGVITFDGKVSKIGYQAFSSCKDLTSICIPNGVTTIESYAFNYCENLLSIEMPNSITTIERYAFASCYNLSAATIPNRVTKISEYLFWSCKNIKKVIIPNSVDTIEKSAFQYCNNLTDITIPNSVTAIGSYAFNNCKSLTRISIPDNIVYIGEDAFSYCDNLSQITIGNNVTTIGLGAFRYCNNLTCLTIPNSVTSIGASTLWGCTNLSSVTLSNNITKIEDYLFYQCNNLKAVTIPGNVASIGKESFRYCSNLTKITIPESVASIGNYAFRDCNGLNEIYSLPIVAPSGGNYAFDTNRSGCKIYVYNECVDNYKSTWSNYVNYIYANGNYPYGTLTDIYYTTNDGQKISSNKLAIKSNTYNNGQGKMVIYGELQLIPDEAFYKCDNLSSITIPDCVNMIGKRAFKDCGSLLSVNLGKGITIIGDDAFYNCDNMTSITLPDNVTTIGYYAFYDCDKLETAILGKGISISTIGYYIFEGCERLKEFRGKFTSDDGRCMVINGILHSFAPYGITEYTIPNNVTNIDWYAFRNIGSLTTITIPDNVTCIGSNAFYGCSNLTTVTISDKIETIQSYAFNSCSKLKNVYCMAPEPPSLGDGAFYNNAYGRKIYVPYESVDKYKDSYSNKGWNDYEYYSAITGYQF